MSARILLVGPAAWCASRARGCKGSLLSFACSRGETPIPPRRGGWPPNEVRRSGGEEASKSPPDLASLDHPPLRGGISEGGASRLHDYIRCESGPVWPAIGFSR